MANPVVLVKCPNTVSPRDLDDIRWYFEDRRVGGRLIPNGIQFLHAGCFVMKFVDVESCNRILLRDKHLVMIGEDDVEMTVERCPSDVAVNCILQASLRKEVPTENRERFASGSVQRIDIVPDDCHWNEIAPALGSEESGDPEDAAKDMAEDNFEDDKTVVPLKAEDSRLSRSSNILGVHRLSVGSEEEIVAKRIKLEKMDSVENQEQEPYSEKNFTGSSSVDMSCSSSSDPGARSRMIQVLDVPSDTVDILELYLESEKNGGGLVDSISHDKENHVCVVTFAEENVAKHFLSKGSLSVNGQILQISCLPDMGCHGNGVKEEKMDPVEDVRPVPMTTIEVKGVKPRLTAEVLRLYFENRKRSGGGAVNDILVFPEEERAVVTFQEVEDAKRVLEFGRHSLLDFSLECEAMDGGMGGTLSHAVEVTGFSEKISEEMLLLFFENRKRSGGDQVEEIFYSAEELRAVITFKSHEVAERILRNHWNSPIVLNDVRLRVSLLKPVPVSACASGDVELDKVLATNIPADSSSEDLVHYLQRGAGTSVKRLRYSLQPGTVMACFDDTYDFSRLRELVTSRPFRGVMLGIQKVPVSRSIQIHNIGTISISHLVLYFESSKSGGGEVIDSFINSDGVYAILKFSDGEVLLTVLSRPHEIEGQKLHISTYYEGLGLMPPGIDDGKPTWWLPPDVSIECDSQKLSFIKASPRLQKNLEKELEAMHCEVEWPTLTGDDDLGKNCKVTLRCILSLKTANAYSLAKTWTLSCKEKLLKECDEILVEEVSILQELWRIVIERMKPLEKGIREDDNVHLSIDDDNCVVKIIGVRQSSENFVRSLKELKLNAEEELQREKRKISEQIPKLKCHQFELLDLAGLLKSDSDDGGVDVTVKGTDVIFYGQPGDILNKKVKIYEILNAITSESVDVPDFVLGSLKLPMFRDHVSSCLREKGIVSAWDLSPKGLTVYALNQGDIDRTASVVKSEIVQQNLELSPAQVATFTLPAWNSLKTSLKNDFEIVILTEGASSLSLTSTGSGRNVNAILESIHNFIKENEILEEFVMTKRGTAVVISQYMKNELQNICNDFKSCNISIKEDLNAGRPGFVISGTVYGLQSAVNKVVELADLVIESEKVFDRPGMANYLHSSRGKKQIEVVQSRNKVCVEDWEEANASNPSSLGPRKKHLVSKAAADNRARVLEECNLGGSFVLKIVHGDITDYKVDVIVNAANGQLDHYGGVAKVIIDKGGGEIQAECKAHINRKGSLLAGHYYVSKPGRLPCKYIIHAVGPIWENGRKNEENVLFETIYNILAEAEDLKVRSIAMPAISTGVFGFPMRKAAKTILEAIEEFVKKESIYFLKEVHIIDNNRYATDEFLGTLGKKEGSMFSKYQRNSSLDQPIVINDDDDAAASSKSFVPRSASSHTSPMRKKTPFSFSPSRSPGPSLLPSFGMSASPLVTSNALTTQQGVTVTLVKGSIVVQMVDVIVNTTSQTLVLNNGAVSSLILQTAGPSIQVECQQKARGGLVLGQVVVTAGYNLPCQFVYHGYCLNWDNGAGACEKSVRSLLKAVFHEANRSRMTSIAIPAIGTGNLKIPPDLVARIMYEEVEEFSQSCAGTSLTDIRFVVYDKDQPTISAFEKELRFPSRGQKKGKKAAERVLAKSKSMTSGSSSEVGGWSIAINDVKLEVMQGDITKAKTDAIVNSANENLNLKMGAVSAAILEAGGQEIQAECTKIGKMTDGMTVTGAGRLPCKKIFHLKAHTTEKGWRKSIENCLAEADRCRIESITFPLLGTGNIKAPVHMMASVMLDAVINFSSKSSPQHLSLIHISIFQPHMVEEFAKAIDVKVNEHQSSGFFDRIKVYVKSLFGVSDKPSSAMSIDVQEIPQEVVRKFDERVRFTIYGLTKKSIEGAIVEMDEMCREVIQDKVIEKDTIAKLSDEQIGKIKSLESEYSVKITVERGHRINRIRLQGEGQTIISVLDKIYAIFGEVEERERQEYHAEIVAQQAQWMYQCDDSYDPYPKPINLIIEKAYQGQLSFAKWEEEDGAYQLDFHRMEETKNGDTKNVVKVKRMTSESSIPKCWDTMNADELCKRVSLPSTSQEYQDVLRNINATAGGTLQQIISIERIQNPSLYQQYVVRREAMQRLQQGTSFQCERILWHGTSTDTLESINHHGFNRSYCGKNAVVYGKGVYFAHNFNYSAANTYAVPDANGNKHVYQSRVLTGEFTTGHQTYFVAPTKSSSTAAIYDSVVDNLSAPTVFVIFSDTQAYPEYLIVFK